MECPQCKQAIQDGEPTFTFNETKKRGRHHRHKRTHFVCNSCDVWVGIEMPSNSSGD